MPPETLDWGPLVSSILTHDTGRARAQWDACVAVLGNPQAYEPVDYMPRPPLLDRVNLEDVVGHSARAEEQKSEASKNIVRAYASWRTHVTQVEAINAGRLFMLACTLRTLADLQARSAKPELVSARIAELGSFIERAWGVAIPLSGDARAWSQRVTRRYDLLSKEWRRV